MSSSPLGYLDALIAGIRAFGQELSAARAWQERARQTQALTWRLSFLSTSRRRLENAAGHLNNTKLRLQDLGPPEKLLPPLDKLAESLRSMQHDWDRESETLSREEQELLSTPIGHA